MKLHKVLILLFFIIVGLKSVAQNTLGKNKSTTSIYAVFDSFFEDEIKKQGVKGNWIFKLNEITGFHKFDFNEDGFQDVFMEFSAVQEETEGMTLYFAVLFRNKLDKEYVLVNYLGTPEIRFTRFEETLFYFHSSLNISDKIVYELVNSKFIKQ